MGIYWNRVQDKMSDRHLNWKNDFVSALADLERIPGASTATLSKVSRNLAELDDVKTTVPLDLLLGRFIKMTEVFQPFKLQFDSPAQALQLLKDYENGLLVVSVSRQQPGSLIYGVSVIENLVERNKLFQGIQNGQPDWGIEATPIKDRVIADLAASTLRDMGYPCHVLSIQMRTTETKIAKTLLDLGFIFQEKDNEFAAIGGTDNGTD